METENVSKSQIEVWEWKEKAAESVKSLPPGERIRMIINRTSDIAATFTRHKRKKSSNIKNLVSGVSI